MLLFLKGCKIQTLLLKNTNRKSYRPYTLYKLVPLRLTLSYPVGSFNILGSVYIYIYFLPYSPSIKLSTK